MSKKLGKRQQYVVNELSKENYFLQEFIEHGVGVQYDICDNDGNVYSKVRPALAESLIKRDLFDYGFSIASLQAEVTHMTLKKSEINLNITTKPHTP